MNFNIVIILAHWDTSIQTHTHTHTTGNEKNDEWIELLLDGRFSNWFPSSFSLANEAKKKKWNKQTEILKIHKRRTLVWKFTCEY